jgi:hypothetical protein
MPDAAHDLLAHAFHLRPDDPAMRLPVAKDMLRVAEGTGRADQMAAGATACALCRIGLADATESGRLAAFEAMELAIERVAEAPEPARAQLAQSLVHPLR